MIVANGATLGVMAAIPDSTTGIISACRNNSNGSLKAVDVQSGATCGSSETLISWPSNIPQVSVPQTAIARIMTGASEFQGVLDVANSRNVTTFKSVIPSPEEGGFIGFCIKVSFAPKAGLIEQGGGGEMRTSGILGITATQQSIDSICGTGDYNVIISGESFSGAIYITE